MSVVFNPKTGKYESSSAVAVKSTNRQAYFNPSSGQYEMSDKPFVVAKPTPVTQISPVKQEVKVESAKSTPQKKSTIQKLKDWFQPTEKVRARDVVREMGNTVFNAGKSVAKGATEGTRAMGQNIASVATAGNTIKTIENIQNQRQSQFESLRKQYKATSDPNKKAQIKKRMAQYAQPVDVEKQVKEINPEIYKKDRQVLGDAVLMITEMAAGGSLPSKGMEGATAKQGLKQVVKEGAKSGAKYGAMAGAINTAREDKVSVKSAAKNIIKGTVGGAASGAALSAAGYGLQKLISKGAGKKVSEITEEQKSLYDSSPPVTEKTNKPVIKIDPETKLKINQKRAELNSLKEELVNDPARQLSKYAKNGQLPEVIGEGGKFGKTGDQLVTELGFNDSEEARAAYSRYYDRVQNYKNLHSELKDIVSKANMGSSELVKYNENGDVIKKPLENITEVVPNQKPVTEMTQQEAKNAENNLYYKAENGKEGFDNHLRTFLDKGKASQTRAIVKANELTNIPADQGMDVIKAIEDPSKVTPATEKYVAEYRKLDDEVFKQAKEAGVDVKYLQNHVSHIWNESPAVVAQKYRTLGKKYGFSMERSIPTYEEGIKLGLTPKYSHPAPILAEQITKLEKVKNSLELFNNLKNEGYVIDHYAPGLVRVNAPGFPRSTTKVGDVITEGGFYTTPEINTKMDKIFSYRPDTKLSKVLNVTGKASSTIQDITMSGGIPHTPVNAWTAAQTTKEVMGGRIKSPVTSIVRSTSDKASKKFFLSHADTIEKMQMHDIDVATTLSIDNLVKNTNEKGAKKIGNIWNKNMNNPTFRRFMPMMQINYFEDVEKSALKSGMGAEEASKIAAEATKHWYAPTSISGRALADKEAQDAVKTLFFAPQYRQTMISFWGKSAKSISPVDVDKLFEGKLGLNNPLSKVNRTNTIFLLNTAAAYIAMNELNKKYNNGRPMKDNPKGKEDKLMIPTKNGKTIGIPFLSSIATMPRTGYKVAKDIVQGDTKQAGIEAKGLLSSLIKPAGDVLTNQNYFGSEIYKDTDTGKVKTKKQASYLLQQYLHPYIREGINYAEGKQGLTETISKGTEMPLRFYNKKSIGQSYYYDALDAKKKAQAVKSAYKYGKMSEKDAKSQYLKYKAIYEKNKKLYYQAVETH